MKFHMCDPFAPFGREILVGGNSPHMIFNMKFLNENSEKMACPLWNCEICLLINSCESTAATINTKESSDLEKIVLFNDIMKSPKSRYQSVFQRQFHFLDTLIVLGPYFYNKKTSFQVMIIIQG